MRYPDYTGEEPCAQIGPWAYQDRQLDPLMVARLRRACSGCVMLDPCREWAVHHEGRDSGFWAGMTAEDRRLERKRRGITLVDPVSWMHRASA